MAQKKPATHSLKYALRYACRPENLFDALTDHRMVTSYTQSPAKIDPVKDGEFSLFGDVVVGRFVELEKPTKIRQSWRFRNWPDEISSEVTITLTEESRGRTRLEFLQTGIPELDKFGIEVLPHVKRGWQSQFWERFERVLGFKKFADDDSDDDDF